MHSHLDDHLAVVAAIRELLSVSTPGGEAADAMARVATVTKTVPLKKMDAWERMIRAELMAAEGNRSGASWKFWAHPHRFASWLDLCSHDGHRREGALRVMSGGAPSAFLFALALRRLNDWVPQVRNAARETLPQVASNSEAQDVADALWSLLAHWYTWGRMESVDRNAVTLMVSTEAIALALKAKIMGSTVGPAAHVLSQSARAPTFDPWIREFARGAVQPAVREKSYRWLFSRRATWTAGHKWKWTDMKWCKGKLEPILESREIPAAEPFTVTLDAAMSDKSPMVRRVAAEFLIRELGSLGERALPLARRAASDTSPSVAERGQFALKQLNANSKLLPNSSA